MSKKDTQYNWEAIMEANAQEVNAFIDQLNEEEFKTFMREYQEVSPRAAGAYMGRAQRLPDPQGQEKLEPRAPAEKDWADRHTVLTFDRPDADEYNATGEMDQAPAPTAPNNPPKPEASPSFTRIKRMLQR
jgi:hypothetical protein